MTGTTRRRGKDDLLRVAGPALLTALTTGSRRQRTRRLVALAVVVVLALVALLAWERVEDAFAEADATRVTVEVDPAESAQARELLAGLEVRGKGPSTGYDRDLFGAAWADVDRNGCDTRNDILARDLVDETFRDATRGCVVETGTLEDPYTGTTIEFVRGQGTSDLVQIDHVFPLSAAWQHGADRWDEQSRLQFANDPLNLIAVDGPTNGSKGDSTPAAWMPPNRGSWCLYSVRWTQVADRYGLGVTQPDKDMLTRGLDRCPTATPEPQSQD